ncbi:MFS general substrate transporter [Clavulina sp. PMI_390]|nr:MFS general substrate transporter [Clavulina sp. PMI_390]
MALSSADNDPKIDHPADRKSSNLSGSGTPVEQSRDIDEKLSPSPTIVSNAKPDVPYSVFTPRQKWAIVFLAACAGMFSPLAANIYFPAIPSLAKAFGRSTQEINLTVTIYMVFQGITPSLWGSVADSYGRRPIYLSCLSIFAVAQIGLALIPSSSYVGLMILRCISAAGSAPVIALGAGTVGDVATPSERGRYMGMVQMGPMLGPCIGPVFGGLLNQNLGWRAIFWFLTILSGAVLVPFTLFFPETLRSIVGNGSIPARGFNRTAWSIISRKLAKRKGVDVNALKKKSPREAAVKKEINPFIALRYILEKDTFIILFYNAFNYTAFYAVTTTLATVLEDKYGLSTSQTGLCYLAIGAGALTSTPVSGRILDWEFRRLRRRIERSRQGSLEAGLTDEEKRREADARASKKLDPNDLVDFPLEKARLHNQPIYSFMFWGSVIAYGWIVQARAPLPLALIFQFLIGWTIIGLMQTNQVMLVDLYPGKGASVTANNNLCRCLIGAVGTAVVNPIMNAIGTGWTMVIFVAFPILFSPLMVVEWKHGMRWRQERAERNKSAAQKAKESEAGR